MEKEEEEEEEEEKKETHYVQGNDPNNALFQLYEVPRIITLVETESRMVLARSWVHEKLLLNVYTVSVFQDEKISGGE